MTEQNRKWSESPIHDQVKRAGLDNAGEAQALSAPTGSVCANCVHWQSEFEIYGCRTVHSKDEGYCYKHHDYQCDGDTCKDFTQNVEGENKEERRS